MASSDSWATTLMRFYREVAPRQAEYPGTPCILLMPRVPNPRLSPHPVLPRLAIDILILQFRKPITMANETLTPRTRDLDGWRELAARLPLPRHAYVGGEWRDAESGRTFTARNPATGKPLTEVAACDTADVDQAVAIARRTFEDGEWRNLPPTERKARMLAWADAITAHADEIALLETLETGKPIGQTTSVDVPLVGGLRWYAEALDKLYGETAPNGASSVCLVEREPVGVVAAVVPWNYPLIIAGWKLGPALGAGNSVILKPAEQSTLATLRVAALARDAGIPTGALQVITGLGHEPARHWACTMTSTPSASPAPPRSASSSWNTRPAPT